MFSNYLLLFIFNNIKIFVYILKISYGFGKTSKYQQTAHFKYAAHKCQAAVENASPSPQIQ